MAKIMHVYLKITHDIFPPVDGDLTVDTVCVTANDDDMSVDDNSMVTLTLLVRC